MNRFFKSAFSKDINLDSGEEIIQFLLYYKLILEGQAKEIFLRNLTKIFHCNAISNLISFTIESNKIIKLSGPIITVNSSSFCSSIIHYYGKIFSRCLSSMKSPIYHELENKLTNPLSNQNGFVIYSELNKTSKYFNSRVRKSLQHQLLQRKFSVLDTAYVWLNLSSNRYWLLILRKNSGQKIFSDEEKNGMLDFSTSLYDSREKWVSKHIHKLSDAERLQLHFNKMGLSAKQAAQRTGNSWRTVELELANARRKFNVSTTAELTGML